MTLPFKFYQLQLTNSSLFSHGILVNIKGRPALVFFSTSSLLYLFSQYIKKVGNHYSSYVSFSLRFSLLYFLSCLALYFPFFFCQHMKKASNCHLSYVSPYSSSLLTLYSLVSFQLCLQSHPLSLFTSSLTLSIANIALEQAAHRRVLRSHV